RTVGTTTILVTHDQAEAMALSDRIVVMNAGRVEQIARPHEAYEKPASAFVAGFLGKTNVLRLGPGPLPPGGTRGDDAARGDGTITVRPERIRFASDGVLEGRIATRIFQGNHWLYQVDTAAGNVTVIRQNDGAPAPAEGETVRLAW
ncbi:MAG TPA: TOBE domain-containing protein, partial [Usitatibacter sp.]|nr:TOBE domain-containing protein [Usitatibacter sp.]